MTCRIVEADCKHFGERRRRGFDLTPFCTNFWLPGMIVPAGLCIRIAPKIEALVAALGYTPRTGPDGYEYIANIIGGGSIGQAGQKEPRFGTDPVNDGSVTWTRQAISAASLYRTIVSPGVNVQWLFPVQMTVDSALSVIGAVVHIAAFHAGGTSGDKHRVIARVTFSDGTCEDFGLDWTITPDDA